MEKQPKKKPTKVSLKKKVSEAEIASQKAQAAREKMKAARNLQPGTVIGGNKELWSYYNATKQEPEATRIRLFLESKGYELCTDGETMIGFPDGALYRCPKEITDERAKERALKKNKR
jgi:muramoyltetrapeptide carboxypeptidase LdcA involved in peptidoglycan recycling